MAWKLEDLDMQVEITIEDMDSDSEDEVLVKPKPTNNAPSPPALQAPLLLKGIRTFKPFPPAN